MALFDDSALGYDNPLGHFVDSLQVTGIDISKAMLTKANEKENAKQIELLHGDIHALPFTEENL